MGKKDMGYRPSSYWNVADPRTAIEGNVKGTVRRSIISCCLEQESLEDFPDVLLEDTLSDEAREVIGSLHPQFMSGEYLPNYTVGEVEIARVTLATVTGDVISIRAGKSGDRIRYRIVDEYWDQGVSYSLTRSESVLPLTQGELINLVDSAQMNETEVVFDEKTGQNVEIPVSPGLTGMHRDANVESGFENVVNFVSVESVFYPGLRDHYLKEARAWFIDKFMSLCFDDITSPPPWLWKDERLLDADGGELAELTPSEFGCLPSGLIQLAPELFVTLTTIVREHWRDLPLEYVSVVTDYCAKLHDLEW
jgi:hypothetical protein